MTVTRQQLKHIKSLRTKKGRREQKQFAAEGVRLLETALVHSTIPETVFCVPEELSERAQRLVERFRQTGVQVEELDSSQLASAADTETPQSILGIFAYPKTELENVYRPTHQRVVICDGVADPGNLGALIRSALAFDFQLVVVTGSSADPYSPKVVRSTTGAVFGIAIAQASTDELITLLEREGFELIVTSNRSGDDREELRSALSTHRFALAIGSESDGVSTPITERSRLAWCVRHAAQVESLNAAIAGSIVLKEIFDLLQPPDSASP